MPTRRPRPTAIEPRSVATATENPWPASQGVDRRGRHYEELLCERGFYKCIHSVSGPRIAITFGDFRPLGDGKTADNHFRAQCEFMPDLRIGGFTGVIIETVLFDRALKSAVERRLKQNKKWLYDPDNDMFEATERFWLMITHLLLVFGLFSP